MSSDTSSTSSSSIEMSLTSSIRSEDNADDQWLECTLDCLEKKLETRLKELLVKECMSDWTHILEILIPSLNSQDSINYLFSNGRRMNDLLKEYLLPHNITLRQLLSAVQKLERKNFIEFLLSDEVRKVACQHLAKSLQTQSVPNGSSGTCDHVVLPCPRAISAPSGYVRTCDDHILRLLQFQTSLDEAIEKSYRIIQPRQSDTDRLPGVMLLISPTDIEHGIKIVENSPRWKCIAPIVENKSNKGKVKMFLKECFEKDVSIVILYTQTYHDEIIARKKTKFTTGLNTAYTFNMLRKYSEPSQASQRHIYLIVETMENVPPWLEKAATSSVLISAEENVYEQSEL